MLAESGDSFLLPKLKKKMASAPPCISYFGGAFRQAEYQPLAFTSKLNKKNGVRSALYFLLWGKPFGRQSTSHSLLLQNSTKKWRALATGDTVVEMGTVAGRPKASG